VKDLQNRFWHDGKSGASSDAGDHRLIRSELHDPLGHHVRTFQPFLDPPAIGAALRKGNER
jgi:hypothetical protein